MAGICFMAGPAPEPRSSASRARLFLVMFRRSKDHIFRVRGRKVTSGSSSVFSREGGAALAAEGPASLGTLPTGTSRRARHRRCCWMQPGFCARAHTHTHSMSDRAVPSLPAKRGDKQQWSWRKVSAAFSLSLSPDRSFPLIQPALFLAPRLSFVSLCLRFSDFVTCVSA